MNDGGKFGKWITDERGLPAIEIDPADVLSSGEAPAGTLPLATPSQAGTDLVLPEGGPGRIWHLLGAETLIATAHLCGDITLYYMPRTLLKLTGDPGSQKRLVWVGSRSHSLEWPETVVFGIGYCEWRYAIAAFDDREGPGEVRVLRRATVEGSGRISISVEITDSGREARYEEAWIVTPEPLLLIPLMGSGPVPLDDAEISEKIYRHLAYAASGVLRGAGTILRTSARLATRLEVTAEERKVSVVGSEYGGLLRAAAALGWPGLPWTKASSPEEPAAVDTGIPALSIETQGDIERATVSGVGGRGRAELKLASTPKVGETLAYVVSAVDDPCGDSSPGPPLDDIREPVPSGLPSLRDEVLDRELVWHLSYLRGLAVADEYFGRRFVTQGSAYTFLQGAHGAPRDYAISVAALSSLDPPLARSTLEVIMMMTRPSGSMFYMHAGRGWCSDAVIHKRPSDLPIFLLWAICEYVECSGDDRFLDERVAFYPLHERRESTVAERIGLAFRWLRDRLGRGPHGMLRVGSGDWADPISMMVDDTRAFHRNGESGPNTAFAVHALSRASVLIRSRDPETAADMDSFAAELAQAMEDAWTGSWYLRGWDGTGEPLGDSHLFLDAQVFSLIAGLGDDERRRTLIEQIRSRSIDPSPIGALYIDRPHPSRFGILPAGWDCNGGVWAAINAFLVWGLARYEPELAWECLRKQSLAAHARAYPHIWYGIWSGPDAYNAHYAERPGETFNLPATPMSEYPVMNSNAHAGPLLAARKIAESRRA